MVRLATRFVILGQARSGTWFYTHLLNQHPQIIAAGELFHFSATVRREMFANVLPDVDTSGEQHAMNGSLDRYVYEPIAEANPDALAIGFKMLYEHVNGWWARGDRCIERDSRVRVIHIVRRHPIDVLVSWRIACLDQAWWNSKTTRQVFIEPTSALDWLERRERWIAWGDSLRSTHSVLVVDYDAMIANPQWAMNEACNFLSLDSVPVTKCSSKRQDTREHLRDKIKNYSELASALRNTPWALTNE